MNSTARASARASFSGAVMAKKVVTRGAGITKHSVIEYSGDDVGEALSRFRAFPDNLEDIEAWCAAALQEANREMGPGTKLPEHSKAWFAFKILQDLQLMKAQIKAGRSGDAAMFAYDAGRLVGLATLKFPWEPYAIAAKKSRSGSKAGGDKTAATSPVIAHAHELRERIRAVAISMPGRGHGYGEQKDLMARFGATDKQVRNAIGPRPRKIRKGRG